MFVAFLFCTMAIAGDAEALTDVPSRQIHVGPDLVAGEPSPPQQIGGVLVGERFDRTGFTCDEAGAVCERLYRWDVLEGDLRVDTCGELAQRVGFHVMFTRDRPRARRQLAGRPSSHAVPDPEIRAIEAVAVLLVPVKDWEPLPPEYAESEGASVKLTALVAPHGQRRMIMSSLGKGRAWLGKSWIVGTWAEADAPCPTETAGGGAP